MTDPPLPQPTGVRLAELLAVLSLGADLGMGQPMEHAMRQCLIAMRLGQRLGLERNNGRACTMCRSSRGPAVTSTRTSRPSGLVTTWRSRVTPGCATQGREVKRAGIKSRGLSAWG